ncbi:hypothetical protein MAHJHV63_36140 [Mycobacterium avium subsp. hominissuis]
MPNGTTNPWSESNSPSLRGNQGDSNTQGFNLAEANTTWGFTLDNQPAQHAAQEVL